MGVSQSRRRGSSRSGASTGTKWPTPSRISTRGRLAGANHSKRFECFDARQYVEEFL